MLGLTKEIIREFRESGSYIEGVDWNKVPSKRPQKLWAVEWTEAGVQSLKANIGYKPVDVENVQPNKRGTVVAKFRNPKIVRVDFGGEVAHVLVSSSEKFKIGMHIDCRWDGHRYVARRTPRFFGKY